MVQLSGQSPAVRIGQCRFCLSRGGPGKRSHRASGDWPIGRPPKRRKVHTTGGNRIVATDPLQAGPLQTNRSQVTFGSNFAEGPAGDIGVSDHFSGRIAPQRLDRSPGSGSLFVRTIGSISSITGGSASISLYTLTH